jgi:hypothetical protein
VYLKPLTSFHQQRIQKDVSKQATTLYEVVHKAYLKRDTTYISTIYPVNNFIENSQDQRKAKWISAQKYDLFR